MSDMEAKIRAKEETLFLVRDLNHGCREILCAAEAVIAGRVELDKLEAAREDSKAAEMQLYRSWWALNDGVRAYLAALAKLYSAESHARWAKEHRPLLAEIDVVREALDDEHLLAEIEVAREMLVDEYQWHSRSIKHVEKLMESGKVQMLRAHLETTCQELEREVDAAYAAAYAA